MEDKQNVQSKNELTVIKTGDKKKTLIKYNLETNENFDLKNAKMLVNIHHKQTTI